MGLVILGIHDHGAFADGNIVDPVFLEQRHGIFHHPGCGDHAPLRKGHCPGPEDDVWLDEDLTVAGQFSD